MSETRSTVNSGQVVAEFGAAFAKKDFVSARRLLHDDLTFRGPIDTFHRADDYIASIRTYFDARPFAPPRGSPG